MTADLTEAVQRCQTCQQSQPAQTKEPMMTCPVPQFPWQVVASDCFQLEGEFYVVAVDLYSDYIEVGQLSDLTSEALISQLKPIFATHVTPAVLITDNGSNYDSREFKEFATSWDFRHVTTSPRHHQANGKAESAVKIIKNIVKKAKKDGSDKWKAILEWRNAPTPNSFSSPAQRLMSRRTRSFLPCKDSLYQPELQQRVPNEVLHKRRVAKYYHDLNVKPLPKLCIGQPQKPRSDWTSGTVLSKAALRSYIVEVQGRQYQRNRVHIRDTLEPRQTETPPLTETSTRNRVHIRDTLDPHQTETLPLTETNTNDPAPDPPKTNADTDSLSTQEKTALQTNHQVEPQLPRTKSGRVVKPPLRFRDSC